MVKIIKGFTESNGDASNAARYWYVLGIVAGFGFLTKYSIVFFYVALVGALLLTRHRKIFLTRYPYICLVIALIISFPNIWWQYAHDFPIVHHMQELASKQLVNVTTAAFLIPQFLDHFACTLIWLPGLIFGLYHRSLKDYRFLSFAYLLVTLLIWPMAIPVLLVERMQEYSIYLRDDIGIKAPFRWQDGIFRDLRQDYADMQGWEEIPEKVSDHYHSLTPEQQQKCMIYAGHYGQAGVLNLHRKKYELPQTYSFNASFVAWVPEDLDFEIQIQVDDNRQTASSYFESVVLIDSIENPYARDPGYIYLKSQPKMDLRPFGKNWYWSVGRRQDINELFMRLFV